jgi:hypothetical protein
LLLRSSRQRDSGAAINPALTVQILDQFNNLTASSATVTLAIGANQAAAR